MRNKRVYIALIFLFSCAISYAQAPTANFKSDVTSGCSPIVVNFQDISFGNPTSWLWDFGNGGTSTLKNPSTTYLTPGSYTVTLTATNAAGSNTVVKQDYITVVDPPTVDFIYDKNSGCTPYKIQFSDQSLQAPNTINTSWFWDFGDGQTSAQKNPLHTYRTAGSFTVSLKVTNDKGCAKTTTKANVINIIPGVVPAFDNSAPTTCSAPATINFTNNTSAPGTVSYKWDFGDGQTASVTSPTHTYATVGTYNVSLIASSSLGCTDTLIKPISIGGYKTDFTVPVFCEGKRTQLTNASSPAPVSSFWIFPDGTTSTDINPRVVFFGTTGLPVKLINNYGNCSDSVTKDVTPTGKPNITFAGIDSGKCSAPSTVNFNNTTGAVSYFWDFGDTTTSTQTNPTHTYTKFGEYSVTLVATNAAGCTDTLTKKNYIRIKKPIITFPDLPQKGCIPYSANFNPVIVDSVEPIVTYLWNFGDGGTSGQAQPTHIYNTRGDYDVTLTITTKSGCVEKLTLPKAVRVGPAAVADFTVDQTNVCAGGGVNFTDLSTPSLQINEWKWEFSDGQISADKNPANIIFQDTGWIDVKLTVYNNGCPSTPVSKANYIYTLPPVSKFDYTIPDCNNRTTYAFTDKSIAADTWVWDFGDGSPTFTGQTPPAHTFSGLGSYTVSLTTTKGACTYTGKRTILIANNKPDFTVDFAAGCKPFVPHLMPAAPNPGFIAQYTWDFGNGSGITNPDANPVYASTGYYNVTLTTTDTFGCKDTTIKNNFIRVNGPVASFSSTTNQGCKGLTATFMDQSSPDGVNPIVKWQWEFGDGKSQGFTQPPFTHVYDTLGNFDVQMFVQDAAGCIDKLFIPEFVKVSTLKAAWSFSNQTCPNSPIYFGNNTRSQFSFSSFWDLGDGTTANTFETSHAYTDTGFYSIKLKVKDQYGCEDSLIANNFVQVGLPKADFTANNFVSFCTPFEAKFINTSTFFIDRSWDLAIATSTQENPSIYYSNTGTYDIKLTVTSPGGCTDDTTKSLRVYNPSDGTITYSPLFGCMPVTVNFDAFAKMNASFVWDYGDGNVVDTTVNEISHIYKDFGSFIPKIIMTEPSGVCKIALTGKDTIHVVGANANFGINKNLFCDSGYLRISDSTITNDPALSYLWDYGDGATSTNANDTVHYYSTPGNYSLFLRVTTANGCVDSLRTALKVVQSPMISITSDSVICANDYVSYTGIMDRPDTSVVKWLWKFPNGNTVQVQNPGRQQYLTAGNFNLLVYAVNSSGCADSINQSLLVHPLPKITLPSILTMQNGFPITIPGTYSSNVVSYSWLPDDNTLSCIDCPQPVTTNTKFTTKYSVSVVDSNSCKNTESVQVIVICKNGNVFVPNTFSPNGDGSNDIFYVRGKGLERVKSLRIFNRWGEIVFEQRDFAVNDPSVGWNGKYKGNRPQADVYVYQVEVFCENSEIIRFEGNVALIQ